MVDQVPNTVVAVGVTAFVQSTFLKLISTITTPALHQLYTSETRIEILLLHIFYIWGYLIHIFISQEIADTVLSTYAYANKLCLLSLV